MVKSTRSANTFGRSMTKTSSVSQRAFSGMTRSMTRSIAGVSTALLGGAGLAFAVRAVVSEAAEMQKVTAQLNAVIESTGGVAGVTTKHVDELATRLLNLSGVDDELIKNAAKLLLTFTNIRNRHSRDNDIFDQATLATLNLSTRFGRDLTGSAITLGKALQDPVKGFLALRGRRSVHGGGTEDDQSAGQVGRLLEAQKVILAEVEKQTRGSAEAYGDTLAGKLGKVRENVLNLAGAMASALLPVLTPLVDKAVAWLENTKNQEQVMRTFKEVVAAVSDVLGVLRGVFSQLNDITGSTKNTVKLLLGALGAYKTIKIASVLAGFADQIGLIGTNAKTARGQVGGLRGSLGKLAAIRTITVAVAIAFSITGSDTFERIRKRAEEGLGRLGFLTKNLDPRSEGSVFKEFMKDTQAMIDAWKEVLGLQKEAAVRPPAGVRGPRDIVLPPAGARGPVGVVGARPPGVVDTETKKEREARLARIRASHEAARLIVQERAAFAVERATATAALTDDLAALNRYNALLLRRIRGGHATLELEREQFQTQQEIADVLEQQAEQRAEQRETRQFRILGFGPGGADLVPTAATLRKQLGKAEQALQGTFLDTKKTRSLVARIRKVLADG